jgi:hypothetical protein
LLFFFKAIRKIIRLLLRNAELGQGIEQRVFYRLAFGAVLRWLQRTCLEFDVCIGIEKGGLLCAAHLQKTLGIPCFYYSLELYTKSHPVYDAAVPLMQVLEGEAHAACLGTIIQEPQRAEALYADTGVAECVVPALYFPVTISGANTSKTFALAHKECGAHGSKRQLINFGNHRLRPEQLVTLARNLPEGYTLFMHNTNVSDLRKIVDGFSLSAVTLSEGSLDESQLMEMISRSRIGLCWYDAGITNDRLTAFASEKLTRYLSLGLPIIANAETNFFELCDRYECGIAVNGVEEIAAAIQRIENDYEYYSKNALQTFYAVYNFQVNFDRLEAEIVSLVKK